MSNDDADTKRAGHIAMNAYVLSATQLVTQSQALASRLAAGPLARHAQPCEDAAVQSLAALTSLYAATSALLCEYGVREHQKRQATMENN